MTNEHAHAELIRQQHAEAQGLMPKIKDGTASTFEQRRWMALKVAIETDQRIHEEMWGARVQLA